MLAYDKKFNKNLNKFINKIYGISLRLREIHWFSKNENLHKETGSIANQNIYLIDSIVEQYIAIYGKDTVSINIVPELYTEEYPELVEKLKFLYVRFKSLVPESPEFDGMRSELENYIRNVLTSIYISDMI